MIRKVLSFFILIIFSNYRMIAQCAMCKAGAEQSLEKGATDANWINYGILFLMAIPLILILGLYLLYRHNRKSS